MPTLFLEAFGTLSEGADLITIDAQEEDLHSVFRERAELMGWATTSNDRSPSPLLWAMEEAELTADTDLHSIGFAQVGLEVGPVEPVDLPSRSGYSPLPYRRRSAEPVLVLPALVQCFIDALSRFGVVELSALQVTAISLDPGTRSCAGYLASVLNWFNVTSKSRVNAVIAFDHGLLGGHTESELVANLQRWNDDGPFEFGAAVAVPERHMVKAPAETPFHPVSPQSALGVSVTMPEWTPSAVGWVLANVIDTARAGEPDVSDFMVRVTRV